MKKAVVWVAGIVLLVIISMQLIVSNPATSSATFEEVPTPTVTVTETPLVNCSETRIGPTQVKVDCKANGVSVLSQVIDLPLPPVLPPVTLPPVTVTAVPTVLPTDIITLPGATETVRVPGPTIKVPGPTKTIKVPGEDVTLPSEPGPTKTITISPSGQPDTDDDRVVPTPEDRTFYDRIPGPVKIIGISTLLFIAITGFALLCLWGGYILGYKNSDKENAKFLTSLRDSVRGKHS